jgi:hypothetical protein
MLVGWLVVLQLAAYLKYFLASFVFEFEFPSKMTVPNVFPPKLSIPIYIYMLYFPAKIALQGDFPPKLSLQNLKFPSKMKKATKASSPQNSY